MARGERLRRRDLLVLALSAVAGRALPVGVASAEANYPDRPIRLIIPYSISAGWRV
jgi:hypothetical protein